MLAEGLTSSLVDGGWCRRTSISNPLVDRLGRFVPFGPDEIAALNRLSRRTRRYRADETLIHQHSKPSSVFLMLSGAAFRYRYLADGRRQIFGYVLPGDLCDTQFVIASECDHNVGILSDSHIAMIPLGELMSTMVAFPKIERALLMSAMVDAAIVREWLLSIGQRDAIQKIAHFFCEMTARLQAIGEINADGSFSLPITQSELADTIGLTTVHVNRSLQRLRRDGLVIWNRRKLTVLNREMLETLADFDEGYLRLHPHQETPKLCAYG